MYTHLMVIWVILLGVVLVFTAGAIVLVRQSLPHAGEIIFEISDFTGRPTVYIMDRSHRFLNNLSENRMDRCPQWSPDGDQALSISFDNTTSFWSIYRMNVNGSDVQRISVDNVSGAYPAWSMDGSHSLYIANDIQLYVVDMHTGENTLLAERVDRRMIPSWSPIDQRILYLLDSELYMVDVLTGNRTTLTANFNGLILGAQWMPNGEEILLTAIDGGRYLYRVSLDGGGGEFTPIVNVSTWSPSPIIIAPDGERIAYVDVAQGYWDIYVINADGTDSRLLLRTSRLDDSAYTRQLSWSRDGQHLISIVDDTMQTIDVNTGDVTEFTDGVIRLCTAWRP